MRLKKKQELISELSGIIATALEGRPDLKKMISTLLGSGGKTPVPEKRLTMAERRQIAESMFSTLSLKDKIKKAI